MESVSNAMGRFHQSLLAGDDDDQEFGESDGFVSLSPLQRIYAFAGCLLVGLACLLLNQCHYLFSTSPSNLQYYSPLAIYWQLEVFLIGPCEQVRMMLDPVRVYATAIYVGSVVLSLLCALWFHNKVLTLLAMITEICALIWYSLSYVPFARRIVSELFISCCDTEI